MTDLTKEDQTAYFEWAENIGNQFVPYIAWQAACAYKQKRITELEDRIRNTGFILSALACRLTHDSKNKELEKMAFSALKSLSEGGGE